MSKKFLLSCFLFLTFQITAQQYDLKRIEPRNWWTDMNYSQVQVMLYGSNISELDVLCEELIISNITKTENPNYIFVTLDTKGKDAKVYTLKLNKKGKTKLSVPFELKARRDASSDREGFNTSDVIYLLMPDRFANGDPANDSQPSTVEKSNRTLPGGRHGGDIRGIINNLNYIRNLGATAIWSTPLLEDNDSTYSYHTYGQSDLYKIDPRYGNEAEYLEMVYKAHDLGLKIIMDVVPNHWGASHWMMKDLPTYDWLHQFPGYGQTNYRMTTQNDPYTSTFDKKWCVDGWFVKSMPDLNQSNPLVLNYLVQNTIWWIENANLDGLRVDTYSYNDKEGIAKWTEIITNEYPKMNIVGEVWMHDQALQSYWQANSPVGAIQSYNSHLPSVMDFTLHDAITQAFGEEKQGWDKGMIRLYENFANDFLYSNPFDLLVFSENHDTQRFNHLYPEFEDYKLMLSLLTTIRGIPQIYYGSEIGMKGDKNLGDADIRKDFPGGWETDTQNCFNSEDLSEEQQSYFEFTKTLLNWRKSNKAIHDGKTIQFIPVDNVYVYFRVLDDQAVMVVINNSSDAKSITLENYSEVLQDFNFGWDIIHENAFDLNSTNFVTEGKNAYIIELKNE
jgi:glycosidase